MNRALIERTLAAMDKGYMGHNHAEYAAVMVALREELAKPEPEPVAWALEHSLGLEFSSNYPMCASQEDANDLAKRHLGNLRVVPLYTKGTTNV